MKRTLFFEQAVRRCVVICCAAIGLAVTGTVWPGTAVLAQEYEDAGPTVTVAQVEHLPLIQTFETLGTARALRTTELMPEADGRIETIFVSSGQSVKAGQQILQLDSAEEELALEKAKIKLRAAERVYNRLQQLVGKGAVPAAQWETAEIELETAKVALKEAEVALSRQQVLAPFDGALGMIDLHPGTHVTTSTMVTVLDDYSSLLLDFNIPESAAGSLTKGSTVSAAPMTGETVVQAVVSVVSHRVDPQTRSFGIRARIDQPADWMVPGMSFRVTLDADGGTYPVVPEVAILWGSRGAYLWQVTDGEANRIPITVVRRRDGRVWVDADLSAGTYIVTEGVQKVRQGDPIEIPRQSASSGNAYKVSAND